MPANWSVSTLALAAAVAALLGCANRRDPTENAMTMPGWCDTSPMKPLGIRARMPSPKIVDGFGAVVGVATQRETGDAIDRPQVRLTQSRRGYRLDLPEHLGDSFGGFQIDSVMPGRYRIKIRRLGQRADSLDITVSVGRVDTVRFQLQAYRCIGY